jgi:hypothetical protein
MRECAGYGTLAEFRTNMVKGLLSLCDNRGVSQIITRQWAQTLVQLVDERYPGGNLQFGDIRIRNSVNVLD